jgi:hypothetical protein
MNREEIIKLAREAGFESNSLGVTYTSGWLPDLLERFAALVSAAEREECANLAAWILKMPENDVSAAIRARGVNDT